MFFDGSLSGLDVGAPVDFRGVKVGTVTDITLVYNCTNGSFRIPVHVELEPQRVCYVGDLPPAGNMAVLVEQGLRGQLQSQSFVTGKLKVSLVHEPDSDIVLVGSATDLPEIPTIPTTADMVAKQLKDIPIAATVERLHDAAAGLGDLMSSEETKLALASFSRTMKELEVLSTSLNQTLPEAIGDLKGMLTTVVATLDDVRPAITNLSRDASGLLGGMGESNEKLQSTLVELGETLDSVETLLEKQSPVRYEMRTMMGELTSAAASLRVFLDYMQQHPESLITGKSSSKRK